jgi:hypothetical protein
VFLEEIPFFMMPLKDMTEVKMVGRRRTQLLDDLRNIKRYWELKEEAQDRKRWRRQFIKLKLGRKKCQFSSVSPWTH